MAREELCPAPIAAVRTMTDRARVLDRFTGDWRPARPVDVRPGAVVLLDAARGGYLPDRGFTPADRTPVPPVPDPGHTGETEAIDRDRWSTGATRWVPLVEHLVDTEREAVALLTEFTGGAGATGVPGLTGEQRAAVVLAARLHDLGKAHPVFLESLRRANPDHPPPDDGPQAKSPSGRPLRHDPPHFRHELVTALLLADERTGLLAGVAEPELVTYLALAHHGRVRVTIRGRPDEPPGRLLGVTEGDTTLPLAGIVGEWTLSLARTGFGAGSLTAGALGLRDRPDLGPFRLAFAEALVVAADRRASARYREESG